MKMRARQQDQDILRATGELMQKKTSAGNISDRRFIGEENK
jgi:hypothetical protein